MRISVSHLIHQQINEMKISFLRLTKKRVGIGNDFDHLAQSFHYKIVFLNISSYHMEFTYSIDFSIGLWSPWIHWACLTWHCIPKSHSFGVLTLIDTVMSRLKGLVSTSRTLPKEGRNIGNTFFAAFRAISVMLVGYWRYIRGLWMPKWIPKADKNRRIGKAF